MTSRSECNWDGRTASLCMTEVGSKAGQLPGRGQEDRQENTELCGTPEKHTFTATEQTGRRRQSTVQLQLVYKPLKTLPWMNG